MVDVAPPPDSSATVSGSRDSGAGGTAADWRGRLAELLRREPVTIRFARREALNAAGIYLAVSALAFAVLLLICHHLGYGVVQVLSKWDSKNYLSVAEHGYPHHLSYQPDGVPKWSTLAFFPLVPALIRAVHLVTGLGYPYAGVAVSWLAATAAAVAVHTLARSVLGRRVGYACVGLWACSPYAFALWVPYSEACFSAALMWALIAVIARRWVAAGVLTALAGTIRPTASVLVGVLVLSAGWALLRRRDGWRPWLALALAPLGLVFSWLYLGSRVGRWDGWFEAEKAWGQSFDFGRGSLHFLKQVATYQHIDIRYPVVLALILLVAVAVVALAMDRKVPWPLVLALAGAWELMFGTPGSPLSKPRFMLPFLPILLLLVARPVARLPRLVQGCLYGCGAVFAGWYAVGLLMLFKWSP
ncbi:hypothetical protein [Streptomyces silvisoli]|uniref:Glycosyltransferase RgtA/B/C/D-like domain-containing protein n=1 Tax=Streptomyces silvisoli TaxID=3034235 RepID=A0ABT5ZIE9_9ACTN|nr:hypothetical protein [Streptomyces silvisoli]MDF3289344.1 hypothetical protein [Streptomyces silvisoli]